MFNISEFSSKVNRYGGFAKSSLFVVRLTGLPQVLGESIPAQDLMFLCKTVDVPSFTVATEDHFPNGWGRMERRPAGMDFPAVSSIFYVDSSHSVLKFFHRWQQAIVNYDQSGGPKSSNAGRFPFELAYKNEYVGQMEVLFFSGNSPDKFYTFKYSNVFPIEVGSMTLSWENNDEITNLPVSFAYDEVKVDGTQSGIISGADTSTRSLQRALTTLMGNDTSIASIDRPNSIQDIINQFTTIRNIATQFNPF